MAGEQPSNTAYLPVINSLRGIAAVMIVVHHVTVYLLPQISLAANHLTPFFKKNYLWVDFFFILSGFIACHVYRRSFSEKVSRKDFVIFITSRFARLYPLHVIILILFAIVEVIYLYVYNSWGLLDIHAQLPVPFSGEYSVMKMLLSLTMLNALPQWGSWNGPSWAMSAIWMVAFIVPFLIRILGKWKFAGHVVVSIVCILVLYGLTKMYGTLDIMAAGGLLRCLAETVMGIVCYNMYCTIPSNGLFKSDLTLGLCVLLILATMVLNINHSLTVLGFFFLIFLAAHHGKDSIFSGRHLLVLGDLSFAIYLIHWLPFQILDKAAFLTTGSKFNTIDSPVIVISALSLTLMCIMYASYRVYNNVETRLRIYTKKQLLNVLMPGQPVNRASLN